MLLCPLLLTSTDESGAAFGGFIYSRRALLQGHAGITVIRSGKAMPDVRFLKGFSDQILRGVPIE